LLKHPECEKYIKCSQNFHDKLCFQGKRKLFKILNNKKYLNAVKSFRENSVFQGKRMLFKILND